MAQHIRLDTLGILFMGREHVTGPYLPHVDQIIREVRGEPHQELPLTAADITVNGDSFELRHGVPEEVALEMFYPEMTEPHLVGRGCDVVHRAAEYVSDSGYWLTKSEQQQLDSVVNRMWEVHLVLGHHIPAEELRSYPHLDGRHAVLIDEFYSSCASRPSPTIH